MNVRFVLCADDYAMTPGVTRGILALLDAGRISATGAMTNRPHWRDAARDLARFDSKADLGVHLNLTCGAPLGPMVLAPDGTLPALAVVARAAATSAEAREGIAREIGRQLMAFEDAMGRAPDFVDGHQHVHALPGIRGAVIAAVTSRYPRGSVWLRDPADSVRAILARGVATSKALAVKALASGLGRQARAAGIPTNKGFSGFSDFDPARDYATDLTQSLMCPGPRHLVMCHPGEVDAELIALDPVVDSRAVELKVLLKGTNAQFSGICRFRDL